MEHRAKRWSGSFIVVWEDNTWEFFRCCRCGQLLEDADSRRRGLGRDCAKHAPIDLVYAAKKQDRAKMRADLRARAHIKARRRARGTP